MMEKKRTIQSRDNLKVTVEKGRKFQPSPNQRMNKFKYDWLIMVFFHLLFYWIFWIKTIFLNCYKKIYHHIKRLNKYKHIYTINQQHFYTGHIDTFYVHLITMLIWSQPFHLINESSHLVIGLSCSLTRKYTTCHSSFFTGEWFRNRTAWLSFTSSCSKSSHPSTNCIPILSFPTSGVIQYLTDPHSLIWFCHFSCKLYKNN